MKLPERLEHTDDLVAALVSSHRAAATPAPKADEIVARIERGEIHPLDDLAPPTGAFRPLFGTKAWMIVGTLGAAVLSTLAIVGISEHRVSSSPGAAPLVPPATPLTAAPETRAPAADVPPEIPSQNVESLPSVAVTSPGVASVSSRPSARPATTTSDANRDAAHGAPTSSLRRELELASAARRALRGGDASSCLSSVARYEEEFPSGQFTQEGQVMRIEAMAALGNHDEATRLAHAFLAASPKSPYADRVRSVLARMGTP